MLGLSLDAWTTIMLLSYGAAAIVATVVGVSTYAVVQLQKQAADDAEDALEKYKITAKADADVKISAAREEARTQNKILEKATADANKAAGDANERAAEIMKATAWRQLQPPQVAQFAWSVRNKPGKVLLAWIANDSESLSLAIQISDILGKAHWEITSSSRTYPDRLIWGIHIADSDKTDSAQLLRDALNAASVRFFTDDIPGPGMAFGAVSVRPETFRVI